MKLKAPMAATAVTLLLLAACSLPTPNPTSTSSVTVPTPPTTPPLPTPDLPVEPSSSTPPNSPPSSSSTASATTTSSASEQPVASRKGSIKKVRVTADVYPVRRSGGTATVDLYIASQDPDETFMLFDNLSDGNTETSSKSLTSVDGVRLIDTTAKKAYLAAVTADGACVCSPDDANTSTFNNSVWVTVTFAAPPATAKTVSVSVPTFGTFTNVPVL